jgi:hypothetical protein
MPLLTELKRIRTTIYKDVAPTALAKNGLVAEARGVTVEPAMKMLPAKAKIVELPFLRFRFFTTF